MFIEDILESNQIFDIPSECKTVTEITNYFFDNVLDDYNIIGHTDDDGTYRDITKITNSIFEVKFTDFKKNSTNYSVKLILTILDDSRCHVSYYNLERLKEEYCRDIPNKMTSSQAIEYLKALESITDNEARHKMADEVLFSVISNYCPQADEIIENFIILPKWYS